MEYSVSIDEFSQVSELRARRHADVNCSAHINYSMEIVIVSFGELVMRISDATYSIKSGEAIFVLPFEKHAFHTPKQSLCTVIMFPAALISDVFEFVGNRDYESRVFTLSPELEAFAKAKLDGDDVTLDAIHSKALLVPFAVEITDKCKATKKNTGSQDIFLRLLRLVNENYTSGLNAADYAKMLGIHPVTLSRMFTRHSGLGFCEFCNSIRVANAVNLLLTTKLTVSEIAFQTGFGSIRSFNRRFIELTGETPKAYRRSHSFE